MRESDKQSSHGVDYGCGVLTAKKPLFGINSGFFSGDFILFS
jgi:hypothetical protein